MQYAVRSTPHASRLTPYAVLPSGPRIAVSMTSPWMSHPTPAACLAHSGRSTSTTWPMTAGPAALSVSTL
jgi:hypothetical protein